MPHNLHKLLGEIAELYPSASLEFNPLPSGVCQLDVWMGDRMFTLEYHPTHGTGVSENTPDTPPFVGHDRVFDSVDSAAAFFKELLSEAQSQHSERRESTSLAPAHAQTI